MAYWVCRILLTNGKLVAENTLPKDINLFDGPTPNMGDEIIVTCRGRQLRAKVVWIVFSATGPNRIRVQEISDQGMSPPQPMLQFWGYHVNRILLKSGKIVPADELPKRPYHAPTPEIGDQVGISCQGRDFKARVTGVDWGGENSGDTKDYIQLEEM